MSIHDSFEPGIPDVKGELPFATEYHVPVLCHTVVSELITDPRGSYVDATAGGGGHTAALLAALAPEGRVIAVDRDVSALDAVRNRMPDEVASGRLSLIHSDFRALNRVLAGHQPDGVNGILLDLGVSSHQFDTADRGFSHRWDGPLDMRMDTDASDSAADLVNSLSERDLSHLIRTFGEEPRARWIARAIVACRPIETTQALAEAIRGSTPSREHGKALARVFQALRIVVNDELGALEAVLHAATTHTVLGGRIAVLSYHSLEDRRVKRFLRFGNFEGRSDRDLHGNPLVPWREHNRKPIEADDAEVAANPRARSARLRLAERTALPDLHRT